MMRGVSSWGKSIIHERYCSRVIDGADSTLDAIEKIPVDEKHRPIQEVRIRSVTIHANPIADKAR